MASFPIRATAFVLALSLASLAAPPQASATMIAELTVEELTERADVVVHATVTHVAERTLPVNGRLVPFHLTTLRVLEWLKGSSDGSIVVRELGGESRGVRTEREGTPMYRRGEEVVVFLRRDGDAYTTLGMAQGRFHVVGDARHGRFVARELEGLTYVRRDGSRVEAQAAERRIERDALLRRIRARADGSRSGR